LEHPNVQKYLCYSIHSTESELKENLYEVYLCSKLCDSNLNKEILLQQDKEKNFEDEVLLSWSSQISGGILALHERYMIHRDIKPENILIFKNNTEKKEDWELYISDFGITKQLSYNLENTMSYKGKKTK
jgi:serine/threonine protein kinase